jgi:hypothetical protein
MMGWGCDPGLLRMRRESRMREVVEGAMGSRMGCFALMELQWGCRSV